MNPQGAVTRLYDRAKAFAIDEDAGPDAADLAAAFGDLGFAAQGDTARTLLGQLDVVASWSPDRRALIAQLDAARPEAWALLPDVLWGLADKGMPAMVESIVVAPDEQKLGARLAAWAGGFSEVQARLLLVALRDGIRAASARRDDFAAAQLDVRRKELEAAITGENGYHESTACDRHDCASCQYNGGCEPFAVPEAQTRRLARVAALGEDNAALLDSVLDELEGKTLPPTLPPRSDPAALARRESGDGR